MSVCRSTYSGRLLAEVPWAHGCGRPALPAVCRGCSTSDGEPSTDGPQASHHHLQLCPCCHLRVHVPRGSSHCLLHFADQIIHCLSVACCSNGQILQCYHEQMLKFLNAKNKNKPFILCRHLPFISTWPHLRDGVRPTPSLRCCQNTNRAMLLVCAV